MGLAKDTLFCEYLQDSDRKQNNSANTSSTPKKAIPSSNRKTVCVFLDVFMIVVGLQYVFFTVQWNLNLPNFHLTMFSVQRTIFSSLAF